jgi:hypothetical protein
MRKIIGIVLGNLVDLLFPVFSTNALTIFSMKVFNVLNYGWRRRAFGGDTINTDEQGLRRAVRALAGKAMAAR